MSLFAEFWRQASVSWLLPWFSFPTHSKPGHSSVTCAGRHIRTWQQVNNVECTHTQRYNTMGWHTSQSKVPHPIWNLDPHLKYGSLGSHESAPKTASQSVQPSLHSSPVCPTQIQTDRHANHAMCESVVSMWIMNIIKWCIMLGCDDYSVNCNKIIKQQ